jgi:hypothetical protein
MTLTMGIPVGLLIALVGGGIVLFTKYKRAGVVAIVFGLLFMLGILFVVFLAVNSSM